MPQGLLIAGLVAGVAGAGVSTYSAIKQSEGQKEVIREQQHQEEIRRNMMNVDAQRRQLEALRQAQRARAVALATTTAQGASSGSGLQGAYGQISGQTGNQYSGISEQQSFGNAFFDSNALISQARMGMADASMFGAVGSGLSSVGNSMISASSVYDKVTASPYTPYSGGASYNFGQSAETGFPSLGFQSARYGY